MVADDDRLNGNARVECSGLEGDEARAVGARALGEDHHLPSSPQSEAIRQNFKTSEKDQSGAENVARVGRKNNSLEEVIRRNSKKHQQSF